MGAIWKLITSRCARPPFLWLHGDLRFVYAAVVARKSFRRDTPRRAVRLSQSQGVPPCCSIWCAASTAARPRRKFCGERESVRSCLLRVLALFGHKFVCSTSVSFLETVMIQTSSVKAFARHAARAFLGFGVVVWHAGEETRFGPTFPGPGVRPEGEDTLP